MAITRVVFITLLSLSLLTTYVLCDQELLDNIPNNKGYIKTIETEHGDIYDCVDFYKQPAFNHHALKNHNFHHQMRPSYRPNRTPTSHSYPNKAKSTIPFGLKDNACPLGTVPIRRKDDEIEINSMGKNYTLNQSKPKDGGVTVAISRSKSPKVYHGVSANLTMHNPLVEMYEYSSAQITMKNDPDSIQVGWTANPIYYKGDKSTRMFIYTEIGGVGCYNVDCPGFVLVRSDIPVDSILTPFFEPRGPLSYVDFFIFQDTFNIWWLQIGHDQEPIGFWPDRIFTSLAKSGAHVECGGEAYHDPKAPGGRAPMGSGFTPSSHVATNAYCYNFVVVNEDAKVELVRDTEAYADDPDHVYGIKDEIVPKHGGAGGYDTNIVIEFEHIVIYGGIQNYSATRG
ncbi:hypothetical protein vseg_003795 [Gypsophila vaccaria]